MVSSENVSRARELLDQAAQPALGGESNRLERHLRVAAALGEILSYEPVVVGGTAEDFYTADEYHETDLDIVTWSLTDNEKELLVRLGFEHDGKYWFHAPSHVAVEFPDNHLAGDPARVQEVVTPPGRARIISAEDLYLDRIRQATSDLGNPTFQKSALAIAVTQYGVLDWRYIDEVVGRQDEPKEMKRINSLMRRRARRAILPRTRSTSRTSKPQNQLSKREDQDKRGTQR